MTPAKPNSLEIRREKWLRQLLADPKIEFSHFRVATVIGWHMNRNRGGVAWPGIKTIAKIACIDRRTVMRAIRWLEARDHLRCDAGPQGKTKSRQPLSANAATTWAGRQWRTSHVTR